MEDQTIVLARHGGLGGKEEAGRQKRDVVGPGFLEKDDGGGKMPNAKQGDRESETGSGAGRER